MEAQSQFKHVTGPKGTFESICMTCLLAGVCPSKEELKTWERQHNYKSGSEEPVSQRFKVLAP